MNRFLMLAAVAAAVVGPTAAWADDAAKKKVTIDKTTAIWVLNNVIKEVPQKPEGFFFWATVTNENDFPVTVTGIDLKWERNEKPMTSTAPKVAVTLPAGGSAVIWFPLPQQPTDKWTPKTTFKLEPSEVDRAELGRVEAAKLKAAFEQRGKVVVRGVEAAGWGADFTVANRNAEAAEDVKFLLVGYDDREKVVTATVFHLNNLPGNKAKVLTPCSDPKNKDLDCEEFVFTTRDVLTARRFEVTVMSVGVPHIPPVK